MSFSFKDLEAIPLYKFGSYRGKRVVIYDDDRWLLPVLLAAQNEGLVPSPTLLISFDQHDDAAPPRKGLGRIPELRSGRKFGAEFVELVEKHLAPNDDDWIKAGMELDLISDVIAYGVHKGQPRVDRSYKDHVGVEAPPLHAG